MYFWNNDVLKNRNINTANNKNNAIICKSKDANQLFKGISKIFEDDSLKKQLLEHAKKEVKKWDINRSMKNFEKEICKY